MSQYSYCDLLTIEKTISAADLQYIISGTPRLYYARNMHPIGFYCIKKIRGQNTGHSDLLTIANTICLVDLPKY